MTVGVAGARDCVFSGDRLAELSLGRRKSLNTELLLERREGVWYTCAQVCAQKSDLKELF
jgi:hypothetical protein